MGGKRKREESRLRSGGGSERWIRDRGKGRKPKEPEQTAGKPKGPNRQLENQRARTDSGKPKEPEQTAGKPKEPEQTAGKPKGPNRQLENQSGRTDSWNTDDP